MDERHSHMWLTHGLNYEFMYVYIASWMFQLGCRSTGLMRCISVHVSCIQWRTVNTKGFVLTVK